jgi:hypothetical protein
MTPGASRNLRRSRRKTAHCLRAVTEQCQRRGEQCARVHLLQKVRCTLAALTASALLLATGASVRAQDSGGVIVVTVREAATGKVLSDARVVLFGAALTASRTDARGDVRYSDVPPGMYRIRVVHTGYDPSPAQTVNVTAGRTYAVAVALTGSGLQTIGTISARNGTRVTARADSTSAVRSVSATLEDALDKQPGVTVTTQSSDPSSSLSISLRNHDESQTGLTLDGIPISAPGTTANLRAFNTDLFSGAGVSFAPTAGAPAGTVNFRTLQPTATNQVSGQASLGSFDAANDALAATGTIGRLGYVLEHTSSQSNRPQTFQTYLDESGLTYAHGGETRHLGDLAKLQYDFADGKTSLTATGLLSNNHVDLLCTQATTNVPCGSGPGNGISMRTGFGYATLNTLLGEMTASLSGFTSADSGTIDESNRFIGGTASPFSSSNSTLSRGGTLTLGAPLGTRHELTLTASALASRGTSTPFGSALSTTAARSTSTTTVALSDVYRASPKLTLTEGLSFAGESYGGKSTLASLAAAYRAGDADSLTLSLAAGGTPAGLGFVQGLADPADAQFDCTSGTTVVRNGGDAPQSQAQTSVDLAWTHSGSGGRNVTVDVYRQVERGALAMGLVRADGTNVLNSAYYAALAGAWSSPYACGGTPFSTSGVYLMQGVAGTTQRYQGVDVSTQAPLGHGVLAYATYSIAQATLVALPDSLSAVASDLVVGAQLPGRPMHRAGLTLDGFARGSGTEAILNVQYTGSNNFQHRGPYALVNASISHPAGVGRLTLSETNVFGTGTAPFATDAGAQPVALSNGSSVTLPAFPLGARTLALTYGFTFGGSRIRSSFEQSAPSPSTAQQAVRQFVPRFEAAPAGTDPFAPATARAECTPSDRDRAAPVLAALGALVRNGSGSVPGFATTVRRGTNGEVASVELQPDFPSASASARAGATRPGNAIGPDAPGGGGGPGGGGVPPDGPGGGPPGGDAQNPVFARVRSFFACAYVQSVTPDEARAAGFATAGSANAGPAIAIYAVPDRGIVLVLPPDLPAGGGSIAPSPPPGPGATNAPAAQR